MTSTSEADGSAASDLFAFAPFGTAGLYIMLAFYSRAYLGHWPRYYEYSTAYRSPIFKLVGAAFLLSGAVSVLAGGLLWGRCRAWQAIVFIVGWALLVGLVMANPYGFTDFLID